MERLHFLEAITLNHIWLPSKKQLQSTLGFLVPPDSFPQTLISQAKTLA